MTLVWAALFGLAFGSFSTAAIERIPRGKSLTGRSHCDGCQRALRSWELVPVVSYVLLRGRCATCGAHIATRTPLLEAFCGAMFVAVFWTFHMTAAVAVSCMFVAMTIGLGVLWERRSDA